MSAPIHLLFGRPPAALADVSPDAVQTDPTIPGSAALEEMAPGSCAGLAMAAVSATIERRHDVAAGLRALAPGAPFVVLAPKDAGGSRLAAELEAFGCVFDERAKAHHRICTGRRPADLRGIDEAISAGAPRLDPALGLWTQPGLFSWDRLDPGSKLLMANMPALAGRGADLGCGLGVLAHAVLASPDVKRLDMVDVDRRAVEAARRNVDDARAHVAWGDAREISVEKLDFVVSNPPFHAGGGEDRSLGQAFVRKAAGVLRSGGKLWLVANRHMPYESVARDLFRRLDVVAEAEGFKVLVATK